MEESKNYEHQHPLVLLNEDELISNQSGVVADCSRCGEMVSAPCFGCAEDCRFYLHKVCTDPPLKLNHPLHRHHPLLLMDQSLLIIQNPNYSLGYVCDFCHKKGDKFAYHCSCGLDFHINCALFTFNMTGKNFKELEHVPLQPPLISTKIDDRKCFGCWEPLANYEYFSPDCGIFNLHKKCAKLPLQMNHMCHHRHPLVLQFNSDGLSCKICEVNRGKGLVYGCTPCKLVMHIECLSAPLAVEGNSHPHPLTPFPRRAPFICDACGTQGTYVSYICSTCNIILHKRCILLPRIIKSYWHDHRLFHKYFLPHGFRSLDCIICHDEVSPEHGNYSCSDCNVAVHVNCVTEDKHSFSIVSLEDEDELCNQSSITILERNDVGEATKIKHFKHDHNLMLSSSVGEHEMSCDGCMLPISDPFYSCSQCGFILHKACAELPRKKHVWYHSCKEPLRLISGKTFLCEKCWHLSNVFAYECCGCERKICVRCVIALTPGAQTNHI